MRHGLCINPDGTLQAWTWADPTTPCPIAVPYEAGAVLVDLSALSFDEAQTTLHLIRRAHGQAREVLLEGFPRVALAPVALAPTWHECHVQPGYRRIVYAPTQDWHDQEMRARLIANGRLARGDRVQDVVEETFTHLAAGTERRQRIGQALPTAAGYAQFQLTPMVRLNERRTMTGVETVREFPFSTPVVEW